MKKSLLMLCLSLVTSIGAMCFAQTEQSGDKKNLHPSFEEFMAQRTHFFIQEMKLNDADSAKFVGVYKNLMKDKGELMHKYHVDREVWRKIRSGESLPDSIYVRLVNNDAKMQVEDAQLELQYVEHLSKVLTPKQVFEYRQAEKKFRSNFMRHGRQADNRKK